MFCHSDTMATASYLLDDGRISSEIHSVDAPRENNGFSLAGSPDQPQVVVSADRLGRGLEIVRPRRSKREQICHDEPTVSPVRRELTTSAHGWVV